MTETKKQSRKRRTATENIKKVVSLTIDPALIAHIDEHAELSQMSRSAVIEKAILNYFVQPLPESKNSPVPISEPVNSLVQPNSNYEYAAPQTGKAIFY